MKNYLTKTSRIFRANLEVCFLLTILGSSILLFNAIGPSRAFAQGDNWYVGKGAKPNTYYTYQIQNIDTNQGRPFLMTIYLKEFDDANNYWIAPVYVVDQGKVFNGTLHLSDLDMSALGSSNVSAALVPYRSAYADSLQWLAAFVPKPGLSLSAPYWGKIAAIGGSPISPGGSAKVTTPAGSFDTKDVSWLYGQTNHLWVDPNLPFPVKAQTYAGVTTGNAPTQYAFELQATGTGQPPTPESKSVTPEPPLTIRTPRGTFYIQLLWEPPINASAPEEFGLIFMNDKQEVTTGVTYSFTVTSSNDSVITDLKNQHALDGTSTQTVTLPGPGSYTVEVRVESVAGEPLGMFVESASFGVVAS